MKMQGKKRKSSQISFPDIMKATKDEIQKNHHKQRIAKFILTHVRIPCYDRYHSYRFFFIKVLSCLFLLLFWGMWRNFVMLMLYFILLLLKQNLESKYSFAQNRKVQLRLCKCAFQIRGKGKK